MEDLILLTAGLTSGYLIYSLIGCLIDYRESRLLRFILVIGFGGANAAIIYAGDAFNVCAVLGVCLILIFLCGKGDAETKAAAVMMAFPLMIAMSYVVYNNPFFWAALQKRIEEGSRTRVISFGYLFVTAYARTGIWFILYRYFRKRLTKVKRYMKKEIWRYVIAIGACSLLSIMVAIVSPPAVYADVLTGSTLKRSPFAGWLVVLAAAVTNLGILSLLPLVIESVYLKQEEQKAGIKEEYYQSLEEQQKKVRRLRHDMNQHFQMLQSYLAAEDIDKAKSYLGNLDIAPLHCGGRQFCEDTALNAMLNNRYDKLMEAGADVHFNLDILEITGIEIMDLCTIMSNSLDNALEAVLKIKKARNRKVALKARYKKGYFSYKLTNSKCNEVRVVNGSYISDKPGKNHGYGIENIQEILLKYGGKMYIETTQEEFSLFLYINET